jgi:branched-chain amino acid transport system substrate-binding protein
MGFVDTLQGKAAAAFCRRELGLDRAGVIYNVIDPYSREIADVFRLTFEQHGGTVVVFETVSSDLLEETLRRVEAQKPELLYVPLYSRAAERVARGVRNLGIEVPLMGADGWERQRLKKLSDFEGCYATAHFAVDSDLPPVGPFAAEYHRRYDIDPGDTAALTYDAFNLLLAACRTAAGVTPEKIRQALYDLGPFDGVSGTIDFVDSGDPDKAVMILRFEGGEVFFHQRLQP